MEKTDIAVTHCIIVPMKFCSVAFSLDIYTCIENYLNDVYYTLPSNSQESYGHNKNLTENLQPIYLFCLQSLTYKYNMK